MKSLKIALVSLAIFFLFTILVITGVFTETDKYITIAIQNLLTKSLDTPLSFLSLLGAAEITTIVLFGVLFTLKWRRGLIALFMFGLGTAVELLGKVFLYHPGPPKAFLRYNLDIFFPSGYVQTGHSFPSGHSFRTAFLVLLISYLVFQSKKLSQRNKKIITSLTFLFLFLMLVSRVSLGEHWTTDVIGGLLLGGSLGSLSIYMIEKKDLRPKFLRPL